MDEEIYIKLDNGKKVKHKRSHPECVVADAIPHVMEVEIGTRVLAKWYNRLDTYYPGTVIAVRRSFYDIRFDDGDKGCNELRELRILKQKDLDEGRYHQVCRPFVCLIAMLIDWLIDDDDDDDDDDNTDYVSVIYFTTKKIQLIEVGF